MAAELFVDTSAWYPAAVTRHPDHQRVAAALTSHIRRGVRIVTTNLVLAETHVLLLRRAGREPALRFVRTVRQPPNLVIESSAALEDQALTEWLDRYADHDFSLTDGVSFAVMSERRIATVLSLDHHFAVAGFQVIPDLKS